MKCFGLNDWFIYARVKGHERVALYHMGKLQAWMGYYKIAGGMFFDILENKI